jgi:hypothetical protein
LLNLKIKGGIMAIKRINMDEEPLTSKLVKVKSKEDLVDAALIILRKTQLDTFKEKKTLQEKLDLLNAEFRNKATFKLLNIVNVWMKGKKDPNKSEEEGRYF